MTWAPSSLIGQAIVTDPGGETSSGYRLVAASPAVQPRDADFLESVPQVSDYLHSTPSAGPYLSFCRLPSGAWALTRRFVDGTRRGSYNRIVVHSLMVPEDVLGGLADDPWLLLGKGRLRSLGGEAQSFADIGHGAAQDGFGSLSDLECLAPPDPRRERRALVARRLAFLKRQWEEPRLHACLLSALGAVEAHDRLLLPEGAEGEQLLALVWSSLPVADRLAIPWTTHLAPGTAGLFRLAMTPEAPGEGWIVLDWRRGGVLGSGGDPGPRGLADALLLGRPPWDLVEEGLERRDWALSLARDGGQVGRWIDFCSLGRALPVGGFPTAWELERTLGRFWPASGGGLEDPWLSPEAVLRTAAATLSGLCAKGHELATDRGTIAMALRASGFAPHVLTPAVLSSLRGGEERVLAAGVALALSEEGREATSRARTEDLLDLLVPSGSGAPIRVPQGGLVSQVLEELAVALLATDSSRAERALEPLAGSAAALHRVFRRLPSPGPRDILRLARVADEAGNVEACASLVGDHLIPALADVPGFRDSLLAAEIEWALDRLRPTPVKLTEALRRWDGRLFDLAAAVLHRWARDGWEAAQAVAREMADARASGLRARRSVVGLAAELARARVPVRDWVVFALAEARVLDEAGDVHAAAPFLAFLRETEIDPEEAAHAVGPVIEALSQGGDHRPLGTAHRALTRLVEPGFVTRSTETLRVVERLASLSPAEHLGWAGTVASLARTFEGAGFRDWAGALRLAWWCGLETARWDAFPGAAVEMVESLEGSDQRGIAEHWLDRLETLGDLPGEPDLVAALERAASPEPELSFRVALARLVHGLRGRKTTLEDALAEGEVLAWSCGRVTELRRTLLQRLLPRGAVERACAVLGLLVSQRVWQSTKRALETGELTTFSRSLRDEHLHMLPPVSELARRPAALLAVADLAGGCWEGDETQSRELLREALAAGHPEYAVHFLNTSEARSKRSFMASLERQRDQDLLRRLQRAARTPAGAGITRYLETPRSGANA